MKTNRDPLLRAQQNFPLAVGELHADEPVAFIQRQRDDAALAGIAVGREFGLLDDALRGGHHDEPVFTEFFDRHSRGDLLFAGQRQQIHERLALGSPAGVRNLMDLQPIDLPGIREEQERLVRGRGEQGHDEIFFLDPHADLALAAAPLRPIQGDRVALDVAGMGDRDDDFFVRDHVFQGDLRFFFHDLRPAVVVVGFADLDQLILDDRANQRFAAEDRLEMLDLLQDLLYIPRSVYCAPIA